MGSDKDPGHPMGGNDHWSPGYDGGGFTYIRGQSSDSSHSIFCLHGDRIRWMLLTERW